MPRGWSIALLGALVSASALPSGALAQASDAAGASAPPSSAAETPATDAAVAEPSGASAPEADGWDAIVLSYGGDAPEDVAASARDAAAATLEAEGFRVLPEAEVTARISPARLRDARSIDALRAIGDELGARGVVTTAVWMSDGAAGSVAVSIATGGRSFSGTADVETDLATAAAAAVRAALERQRRALLLDAGTGGSTATVTTSDDDPETEADGNDDGSGAVEGDPWSEDGAARHEEEDDGPSELFGIIGPGFLLAIGGAGLGLGIYGLLDTTCTLRGPTTGVCLRGEEPNLALGTLFVVGGSIALLGAVIWWITDAALSEEPRIDVVDLDLDVLFLEGGAAATVRGSF